MTRPTVRHDGACPLCRREIALMHRLDQRGAIDFVDASDPASGCPTDRDALLARFHAEEDGRMPSGAAAFAAMWRAIPLLRPLGLGYRRWAASEILSPNGEHGTVSPSAGLLDDALS